MSRHRWDSDRDRDLEHARQVARDLDDVIERGAGRALARALAADLGLHLDLALDDVYGHAFGRELTDCDLQLERDLAAARDHALALARDLARGLNLEPGRRDLIRDFCNVVLYARFAYRPRSNLLRQASPEGIPDMQLQETRRITPPALRLLAAAVRLLPPASRGRYAEEYRSELWELTHAGALPRQQTLYALSQLARTAHLRSALLVPRRKNAAP